ncbi:hypothetical protein [Citrobacter sp. RHB25-C09]|uniref:hypothetical protein n=1 Tax=Citrobacter sp. RHB25-C09 TaxID=2742624 RepID=UPI0015EF34DE|nr:hypothetical protein [Citrobacter sp. RHB25-C09]QMI06982.1 hypothetical protein HVY19_19910 [Citrobacter sp. RHB25-C09]
MGRRTQGAGCFNSPYSRIVALDAETLQPLLANWQYEGDSQITQGTGFYDKNAVNRLIVSADEYQSVILNSGNIDYRPGDIITVVNNDGQLKQWGVSVTGYYSLPEKIAEMDNIIDLVCNDEVRIVLTSDGKIMAWGVADAGGTLPDDIAALTGVSKYC